MKKVIPGVVACALIAGSGVYLWKSTAEPEAAQTAVESALQTTSAGGAPRAPDSIDHHVATATTPVAEVTAPVDTNLSSTLEQREEAIGRLASAMRPVYEDVGQEVGLDDPETDALISLLAGQQLRLSDANLDSTPAGAAAFDELKNQFQREIQLQIGPDRAQRLANYQDTINARYEVQEARRVLEAASLPLTDSQRKAWILAAIDHAAFVREPDFLGGGSTVAVLQELLARIDQRDQKLLGIARGILDPQQFQSYESFVTERRERFDASIRREEQESINR